MSTGWSIFIWVWTISFIITQSAFWPRKSKGSTPLWDKNYCTIPPKLMICAAWLTFTSVFAPICMAAVIVMWITLLWQTVVERDVKTKCKQLDKKTFQQRANDLQKDIKNLQQRREAESIEASLHQEMVERAVTETPTETTEISQLEAIYIKMIQEEKNKTHDSPPPKKDSEIQNRFEIMDIE